MACGRKGKTWSDSSWEGDADRRERRWCQNRHQNRRIQNLILDKSKQEKASVREVEVDERRCERLKEGHLTKRNRPRFALGLNSTLSALSVEGGKWTLKRKDKCKGGRTLQTPLR